MQRVAGVGVRRLDRGARCTRRAAAPGRCDVPRHCPLPCWRTLLRVVALTGLLEPDAARRAVSARSSRISEAHAPAALHDLRRFGFRRTQECQRATHASKDSQGQRVRPGYPAHAGTRTRGPRAERTPAHGRFDLAPGDWADEPAGHSWTWR